MEEAYYPLKRKGSEVSSENDFPVFSPATKIRRLDSVGLSCDLPPIVEDVVDEPEFESFSSKTGGLKIEELPQNEDNKAIVLFNPNTPNLVHSPSTFSISVDPNLVSALKYQLPWSNQPRSWKVDGEEEGNNSSNGCMAVVPWVPSQWTSPSQAVQPTLFDDNPDTMEADKMEAEDMEGVEMDVEESVNVEQGNVNGSAVGFSEGLHQWQQHCMVHQLPQNMSSPIVWYQ